TPDGTTVEKTPVSEDAAPIVLVITSKPEGVAVFDGETPHGDTQPVGTTPFEIELDQSGMERVFTFRLEGHQDVVRRSQIPPTQGRSQFKVPGHAVLTPLIRVTWEIESTPSARVVHNDEVLCEKTPSIVERQFVEPTPLEVTLEADNYRASTVVLAAEGGQISEKLR